MFVCIYIYLFICLSVKAVLNTKFGSGLLWTKNIWPDKNSEEEGSSRLSCSLILFILEGSKILNLEVTPCAGGYILFLILRKLPSEIEITKTSVEEVQKKKGKHFEEVCFIITKMWKTANQVAWNDETERGRKLNNITAWATHPCSFN